MLERDGECATRPGAMAPVECESDDDAGDGEDARAMTSASARDGTGRPTATSTIALARAGGRARTDESDDDDDDDDDDDEGDATRAGPDLASALARGVRGDKTAAAQRRGTFVGDQNAQRRLQETLDLVAQAFLECKRADQGSMDVIDGAVSSVQYAHDVMPSYLRMEEESTFDKLARHTKNLARRVGEHETLAKNFSDGVVLGIEKAVAAFDSEMPEAMSNRDGVNAVTSLRALKENLDRARGKLRVGGSTADDKAIHCKNLAEVLMQISTQDTKVTMHSQYIGHPMLDLDSLANDELTTMSHDVKTTDAEYLWRVLRALSDALFQKASIDVFIKKALPTSLQRAFRDAYDARLKVEGALNNLLRRAQMIPFLVIEAYASMDVDKIDIIRDILSVPVDKALPTSFKFLEIHGYVYAAARQDVQFVQPATEKQVIRLLTEQVPFGQGITEKEAATIIKGIERYSKKRPSGSAPAPTKTSPSTPDATSVFDRLAPRDDESRSTPKCKPPLPTAISKAEKKEANKASFAYSKFCTLCKHEIKGFSEAMLKNNFKQHLSSNMHKAASYAKKEAKKAPKAPLDPFGCLAPEDRAFAVMMNVPPPPPTTTNTVNVPPPPAAPGRVDSSDAKPCMRSPPLGLSQSGIDRARGEKMFEGGEIVQPVTGAGQLTQADVADAECQHDYVVKHLAQIETAQKNGKRLCVGQYNDKPRKQSRGPVYCTHWATGKCWNGDACRYRHGYPPPDSPCDSFSG